MLKLGSPFQPDMDKEEDDQRNKNQGTTASAVAHANLGQFHRGNCIFLCDIIIIVSTFCCFFFFKAISKSLLVT